MPSTNHTEAHEPADTDHQALEDELAAVSATPAERQETHRQLKSTYLKLLQSAVTQASERHVPLTAMSTDDVATATFTTLETSFRAVRVRIAPPPVPAPGGFGVVQGGCWYHHALPEFQTRLIPGVPPAAFRMVGALEAGAKVALVAEDCAWNRFKRYLRTATLLSVCEDEAGRLHLELHWRGWQPQTAVVQISS